MEIIEIFKMLWIIVGILFALLIIFAIIVTAIEKIYGTLTKNKKEEEIKEKFEELKDFLELLNELADKCNEEETDEVAKKVAKTSKKKEDK